MGKGEVNRDEHPLMNALIHAQRKRGHTVAQLACALDTGPSHWYRLKRNPAQVERCRRATLDNMAAYVGWPRDKVYSAAFRTFTIAHSEESPNLTDISDFISRSKYSPGLRVPLGQAAPDHLALVIHLFCELQIAVAWIAANLSKQPPPNGPVDIKSQHGKKRV